MIRTTLSQAPYDAVYFEAPAKPTRFWAALLRTLNGTLERTGGVTGAALPLPAYTVAAVPDAATYAYGLIFVTDETGGATVAFSDGAAWRRVQDRAVIS